MKERDGDLRRGGTLVTLAAASRQLTLRASSLSRRPATSYARTVVASSDPSASALELVNRLVVDAVTASTVAEGRAQAALESASQTFEQARTKPGVAEAASAAVGAAREAERAAKRTQDIAREAQQRLAAIVGTNDETQISAAVAQSTA